MSRSSDEKREIRLVVRRRLAEVSAEEMRGWSDAICRRLIEWPSTREAHCAMVYLATPGEAGVDDYTRWRLAQGLTVCGPRVDWQANTLEPRLIEDPDEGVEIRRHGIREPVSGAGAVEAGRIDVVLTPGVAFDESGRRVGRGAGCYDRFFARNDLMEGILAVGVCFEAQLVDRAPADAHDMSVGAIITEQRIIWPIHR